MSEQDKRWDEMRDRIIGFGDASQRKSYYPELRAKISELEEARETIRKSEANLRAVLNSVHDAIILHDRTGRVFDVNDAMLEFYGIRREEVERYSLHDISAPNQRRIEEISDQTLSSGHMVFEWKARRPHDGSLIEVEIAIRPFTWYGQNIFVAVVRDISLRKRMEQMLGESQKMEALGRFAARVAHDVTNSMSSILQSVTKLRKLVSDMPEAVVEVGNIVDAVNRYAGFYGDLLAFAAQRPGPEKVVDIKRIAGSISKLLARSAHPGIGCTFEIAADKLPVLGDPVRIEQMLVYLTLHAIERMPEGGTYTLRVFKKVWEHSSEDSGPECACIIIQDTGKPYAPEDVSHLFEPFFEPGGSANNSLGVRLSSVYSIVHALKGTIDVNSTPTETIVITHIPLHDTTGDAEPEKTTPPQSEPVTPDRLVPDPRGVVLVVDDELGLRTLLTVHLSKLGLQVITAQNAKDALHQTEYYPGSIDYLLADISLGGMTGPELANRIREGRPNMRVVYMSGYGRSALEQNGVLQPSDVFLEKPFTRHALADALKAVSAAT